MKTAIVTGVPGQDASYLCELLLEKDYKVIGVSRRSMRENDNMINCEDHSNYHSYIMDITDVTGMRNLVKQHMPDEFYNLAAMSHVGQSFKEPLATLMIDGYAVAGILEAIKEECKTCRFYQASTSEMFGHNGNFKNDYLCEGGMSQDENTPFGPRSPYGAAKVYAHQMVDVYREGYDLHASCGILFNHESPRRGKDFVTRKITNSVARIKFGLQDKIKLGNLEACRDWGHAKDYVRGMWMMLQQDKPKDYVLATGVAVSVREALAYVCELAELDLEDIYEEDPQFMRPADINYLRGEPRKANTELGWEPDYSWKTLLKEMYENDLKLACDEAI